LGQLGICRFIIITMINKRTIMIGAVGGMTIGSVLPMLWGDYNTFGVTSVLLGMVGGFVGIWLAIVVSKKIDL
jgi:hypothetical protein